MTRSTVRTILFVVFSIAAGPASLPAYQPAVQPASPGSAKIPAGVPREASPGRASIIVRHDRPDDRYRELAEELAGIVVDMNIPFRDPQRRGANGMGVLIADRWVLTAAHVAAALDENHPLGRVRGPHSVTIGGTTFVVTSVHLHPSWRPGGPGPHDIALVHLDSAVPVAPEELPRLYRGSDEVGRDITIVGRGETGTGLTGPTGADDLLRAATNRVDEIFDGQLVFDFDAPDAGDVTDLEGVSGPGDSGGPAFVREGADLYVVGISVAQDGRGRGPGRYGALEFYTRVSDNVAWIDEVVNAPSPAPSGTAQGPHIAEAITPGAARGPYVAEAIAPGTAWGPYFAEAVAPGTAQEVIVAEGVAANVDDYVSRLEPMGFSGAVLLARGSRILLRKGYGVADRETGQPVTPATVFTVGSITKQFTGAAIMKLVTEGRVAVDDSIRDYFAGVPDDKQAITIHHLLTHTSGLQDVFGDDFDTGATRDALLERILDSRLLSTPGETYRYSNAGYSLLGMIIEQVSGLDYEAFLRRNLFEPAGMLHTGYLLPAFDADDLAVGYRDGERWGTVLERPMLADGPGWNLRANGGIHSTAQDMYLWQRALEEGTVLSPEAKEAYEHPWVDEGSGDTFYGYGWVNEDTERGTRLLWHNGGNLVYSADARRYVDEDTFLFVASSVAEFQATALAEALDAVIFGGDITLPPRVQPRSSVDPDDFVGRYELRPGDTITLAARADGIEAIPEGCWAEYLLAGGRDRIAADANELRPRTLAILLAANEGDFGPLREETGSISERMEAKQGEYFGTQVRLGGALRDARVRRCVPFEGELKIIVRMDHDTATFYRWLRWVDGEITGYGFGELLAGGPERTMLFATESGTLVSFALGYETATELRVEHRADGSKALIIGAGDDRVVAPEAGLSR